MHLNPSWKSPKINNLRTYQYSHRFGYKGTIEAKGPKTALKLIAEKHGLSKEEAETTMIAEV